MSSRSVFRVCQAHDGSQIEQFGARLSGFAETLMNHSISSFFTPHGYMFFPGFNGSTGRNGSRLFSSVVAMGP